MDRVTCSWNALKWYRLSYIKSNQIKFILYSHNLTTTSANKFVGKMWLTGCQGYDDCRTYWHPRKIKTHAHLRLFKKYRPINTSQSTFKAIDASSRDNTIVYWRALFYANTVVSECIVLSLIDWQIDKLYVDLIDDIFCYETNFESSGDHHSRIGKHYTLTDNIYNDSCSTRVDGVDRSLMSSHCLQTWYTSRYTSESFRCSVALVLYICKVWREH